jgi:TonB-dependent SusC/RagA subfamily outer membrane receptor
MKKPLLSALLVGLFVWSAFVGWRDDDPPARIMQQLAAYLTGTPQEKGYLHLDRPYYTAGETIWLKGTVVDAATHTADSLSRVLYVDLVDAAAGRVLETRTFRLTGGHAPGQWDLPDTLQAGRYQLRAYTNWMRNWPDFIVQREFDVYASARSVPGPAPVPAADRLEVDFFPEGGNLVVGLESRVAFKAVDGRGLGTPVEGVILNDRRDTVAIMLAEHAGMGRFAMRPEAGRTYTAHLTGGAGQQRQVPLPAALPRGHGLGVDNLTNRDNVRVFITTSHPDASQPRDLYLIAHLRGQVAFVAKGTTARKTFVANVPRKAFPDGGVAHFTLFDAAGVPLAERLAFIQPRARLTIQITPDKPAYKPREAVSLRVAVTDTAGRPVPGAALTMAVTDPRQVIADPEGESLLTYLLLSSDLRGTIERPGQYFDPANANAGPQLDLLLLTQGWRRFTWQQIQNPAHYEKPLFLFEPGLSISGTVRRPNQKVPEKNVRMTLMLSRGEDKQFLMNEADAEGNFGFYGLDFQDTTQILVQAVAGKTNRYLDLALAAPTVPPAVTPSRIPFAPDGRTDLATYQQRTADMLDIARRSRLDKTTTLDEVTVKARKTPEFDGRKIYGQAGTSIKVDQLMSAGMMSVLDIIRGRVAGVMVTGQFPNYQVTIRGVSSINGSNTPLFLVDGVPMDLDAAVNIPVTDVDQIDVLKGAEAAIFGVRGANGAIAILTKRGNSNYDWSKDTTPGTLNRRVRGYELVREFYSPDYGTDRPEHTRPDYRSTLYWNPLLVTDATGQATVRFHNSDEATKLSVHVEGLTVGGVLGVGTMER